MKSSGFLITVVLLTIIISLLCMWFYPSINDFMESNNMWNGIMNFDSTFGATNIDSLDSIPDSAESSALIAIPYLQYNDDDLSKMKQFVDRGGTLLVMDDYGYGNSILSTFNSDVKFSGKPLLDPLFCFKNQWMPRITDFSSEIKADGVEVLMLNHATALVSTGGAEVMAWSSPTSFLDINGTESNRPDDPQGPFPVAATFPSGKGTVVVISDPSILINTMVGRDNNYAFLEYFLSPNGEKKNIMIDRSHLSQTPLDISKTRLEEARQILASPYGQIGFVTLVFFAVSNYMLKKGWLLGRYS